MESAGVYQEVRCQERGEVRRSRNGDKFRMETARAGALTSERRFRLVAREYQYVQATTVIRGNQ